ncbi:histidine phosphatase family protein [Robertmurraya korlensis]|uniref:histidine phosphatase family protein n=1 Tax=Robertmurraya korlensis TaxID=519977 RepID=UPI0008265DFD|nr:histidine phosphatase family protein [Robertmurraya korlensis]
MDDCVVMALCRHGLTEANKKRAYLGWTDSPLCEPPPPLVTSFEGYFTSDLGRCVSTLKALFPDVEPIQMSDLREMHFGDFEGFTFEELKDNEEYIKWLNDYKEIIVPNGESFQQFVRRVEIGWNRMIGKVKNNSWNSSFVVTHAGVIRHLLASYAPDERAYWDWNVSHDCYYELRFTKEGFEKGERAFSLKEVTI